MISGRIIADIFPYSWRDKGRERGENKRGYNKIERWGFWLT